MNFPRRGVVIETGPVLVIKLLSGAKIRVAEDSRFQLGDPAWILWDFTKDRLRKLWTETEYHNDGDPGVEPVEIDMGEDWVPDDEWIRAHPVGS